MSLETGFGEVMLPEARLKLINILPFHHNLLYQFRQERQFDYRPVV